MRSVKMKTDAGLGKRFFAHQRGTGTSGKLSTTIGRVPIRARFGTEKHTGKRTSGINDHALMFFLKKFCFS